MALGRLSLALVMAATLCFGARPTAAAEWTAPSVTVRWVAADRVNISWTPVDGASQYLWSIRTCAGEVVRSGTSSGDARRHAPLSRSECYEGWIQVQFPDGQLGATGRARLPAGASTSTPLDPLPPPGPPPPEPPAVPPGFVDEPAAAVPSPTDLAFLPDGRMLVTSQPGVLYLVDGSAVIPILDLSDRVCTTSERGLLGVAVDPSFTTNGYLYVFYTHDPHDDCSPTAADPAVNRVARFVLGSSSIDPATEMPLLDGMPARRGHNAGDLLVLGGHLYVTVGDGVCDVDDPSRCQNFNDNARSLSLPLGKVLRVGLDGSVPADNPWASAPGARRCAVPDTGPEPGTGPCAEAYAAGLRNPFRMAARPGDGAVFINDVGGTAWEEIDLLAAGADYGWNLREGPCTVGSVVDCPPLPDGFTDPLFAYSHAGGCESITGGTFAPASWPAPHGGSYLFADFVCGGIFRLVEGGGAPGQEPFATGLGDSSAVALETGPAPGGEAVYYASYAGGGEVRRIRYVGTSNTAPVAAITAPDESFRFSVGQTIELAGAGTDAEDGPLAPSLLLWHVTLHDGNQTQTVLGPATGSTVQFTAPPPTSLAAAGLSYLTATLTVTDSAGASTTVTRRLDAVHVALTFATDPSGLRLRAGGTEVTGPTSLTSWAGYTFGLEAISPQQSGGNTHTFQSWTDPAGAGAAAQRTVTTPASPTTYSARYTTSGGGLAAPVVTVRKVATGTLNISSTPVAGAQHYRYEVRTCAGAVVRSGLSSGDPRRASGLAPGCYQGVVWAIAANGAVGPPGSSGQYQLT